ncbi:DUF1102 domain-containing protein [Geoglobus acetivorans]|uniref:DUF1102 domain-containing protein n=1 Tax=Geoglobus acetivorans TaxID=565033 RepID=A0A0A7GGR1_GEOAI|nr:hypothetical protein GACE_2198 [Geoglobus acetivorans]
MRKTGIGLLGIFATLAIILGVGANFSDYNADRSAHWTIVTDDTELIDLEPIQPYAYIGEDGMLAIDFSANNPNYPGYGDGISPSSEYNFDEVFAVSNDLWEQFPIVVRVTSSNANIEFYGHEIPGRVYAVDGGQLATASDSAREDVCFVVQPGDSVKIGIDLSANGDSPGDVWDETMTVKAYRAGTEPAELANCGQT